MPPRPIQNAVHVLDRPVAVRLQICGDKRLTVWPTPFHTQTIAATSKYNYWQHLEPRQLHATDLQYIHYVVYM